MIIMFIILKFFWVKELTIGWCTLISDIRNVWAITPVQDKWVYIEIKITMTLHPWP